MKKKEISIFIILLISLFSISAKAQDKTPLTKEEYKELPLYQKSSVGIDVWGLGSKMFGSDFTSIEGFYAVNLKDRFFPIIEIGYGSMNSTNDNTNIYYKTAAPYFRIGMDYNFFYKKPYLPGYLYGGFRVAHSSFSYDVTAPDMKDPTWGDVTVPFSYTGVKTNVTWAELVVGLKTRIYKNFCMGWSLRYRIQMSMKKSENSEPWYIPGYGTNGSTKLGITYNLIYNLPF